MLDSEASWAAADMCVQTHGRFGFAEEYDIERKFREMRLWKSIAAQLYTEHGAIAVPIVREVLSLQPQASPPVARPSPP
jgi:hypothetical protein